MGGSLDSTVLENSRNNSTLTLTLMKTHSDTTLTQAQRDHRSTRFHHLKSQSYWYLQHLEMECGYQQLSPFTISTNRPMIRDCCHNPGGWLQKQVGTVSGNLCDSALNTGCREKRANQTNGESITTFLSAHSRLTSWLENNLLVTGKAEIEMTT